MEVAKMYLSNLLVGLIFVYCSIYLAGFGAAIAIPANFLIELIAIFSATAAFALVDFVTIGIPILAAYLVIVSVFRMITIHISYLLIAAPYLLFNAFLYLEMRPHDGMFFTILTSLPYVIAVGLCAATMAYKATHNQIN